MCKKSKPQAVEIIKGHIAEGKNLVGIILFCKRCETYIRAIRQRAERVLMLSSQDEDNTEGEEWKRGDQ